MKAYEAATAKIVSQRRPSAGGSGLTFHEPTSLRQDPAPDGPARLSDVLNSISAVVYDWDMLNDGIVWGPNAANVLSAFPERALASGAAFADLVAADSETSRFQAIKDSRIVDQGDGVPYRALYGLTKQDGAKVAVEDIGRWFADGAGRPVRAHGVLRIVAGNGEAGQPTASLSDRDPLTGVYNRNSLIERLNAACLEITRRRSQFAVFVLGIERLGEINQRYGYDVADEVIVAVARRVGENVRETDIFARYLGGKFVFVLDGGDAEQAATAARRLLRVISNDPIGTSVKPIDVCLRIGAALAPQHGRSAHALLQRAEEAYDFACQSVADRYVLFTPTLASDNARLRALSVSDEIVAALNERRIVLAYQPIVPTKPGRRAYVEALLRVRRPDGELIGPATIIPVAEKVGLIAQLDQRVLELALQRMMAEPDLRVSVNVSAATLHAPEWIDQLAQTLAAHPGTAQRLMIEIIETMAIADIEVTAGIFARMKAMGVKVAMDDFGAGHTSFRSLRGLGVDVVKIDGVFVQNIARSADDRFFVRTLVELARHLNIETVAEWVEDAEAMRILTDWGIDYLQGHHLGRAEVPDAARGAIATAARA
jgi:diguanylate cyclase (GGDEF)-like protein